MVLDGTKVSIYDTEPREGQFWVFCGYSNAGCGNADAIPRASQNDIVIVVFLSLFCNIVFVLFAV